MDQNGKNRAASSVVGVETPSSENNRALSDNEETTIDDIDAEKEREIEKTAAMTLGQDAAGSGGAKTTENNTVGSDTITEMEETTSGDVPKSRGKRYIIDAPLIEEKSRSKRSSDPVYQLDSNGVPRISLREEMSSQDSVETGNQDGENTSPDEPRDETNPEAKSRTKRNIITTFDRPSPASQERNERTRVDETGRRRVVYK